MDVLCPLRDTVGESPLWSMTEQAIYWIDIESPAVRRYDWATGQVRSWRCHERVGCIAFHSAGGLIAGMETGIYRLQLADDGQAVATLLCPVKHAEAGMRFNDGRCDREGRFWAGTMVRDMSLSRPVGRLHRFAATGLSGALVDGLITPNGLGFSPDGRVMYLSDSHPTVQRVWAFDLADDGTPLNRRDFIDMNPLPGRPDGAAVDADGCYWICGNDGGVVYRFTPDGRLDRTLAVPVSKPTMCAFGGPRLDTLFITSIRPAQVPPEQAELAGAVFVAHPGVTGLPETAYHG